MSSPYSLGHGDQHRPLASKPPSAPATMALPHRGAYAAPLVRHRPPACQLRPSTPTPGPLELFSAPPEALRNLFAAPDAALAPAFPSEAERPSDVYLASSSSSSPPPALHQLTIPAASVFYVPPPAAGAANLRSVPSSSSSSLPPARHQLTMPAASVFSAPPPAAGAVDLRSPVSKQGTVGNKAMIRSDLLDHRSKDFGWEKTCVESAGQCNLTNKEMINGGTIVTINNWTCLNFSSMHTEDVQRFCMDLTCMCNATGMAVNPEPCVEVMSVAPTHIENTLRDVHWIATQVLGLQGQGNQLQLLIVILPEICGSYEKVKGVSETEIGVFTKCCLPKYVCRPSKQYLQDIALELNFKFGGLKTVLQRALVRNGIVDTRTWSTGIFVSKDQIITSGADVAHPLPAEDTVCSIAHVNVCFCEHEIQMPVKSRKQTILECVLLALMKLHIRARDFYLTKSGKMVDEGMMVNSVLALGPSSIHAVPRMRGGANSIYLCSWYYPLNKIIDAYSKRLVRLVYVHKRMRNKRSNKFAPVLSNFSQYLLHYLLVCVCQEGHLRDISWNGAFRLSDILLYDGHMRISPDVPVHRYSPARGAADYRRLYDIVLLFVDIDSGTYPVHVSNLLNTLLNVEESVRLKPEFVTFLVNHPCLLTFAEKQMVYTLVDRLRSKLPEAVVNRVDRLVGFHGWESIIQDADAFKETYRYVPPQNPPAVQNTPVPGAAVQNPLVPGATVQNPTVPRAAAQNTPVPGAAVQNPLVLGAAVQNPTVPGAAAQNTPVPGAAVQNTIAGVQSYGQGVTGCLHLGRNFLNHPPREANLETAEVAFSFLVEFVLPEVLEVLSKVLTGNHARMFMEILSNPNADKSTVRVSLC